MPRRALLRRRFFARSVHLVAPDRAARPLAAVREFMTDYSAVITMVILVLLGGTLLGDGLTGLL